MATLVVGALVAGGAYMALRHTVRQVKNGECPGGCAGCSGCASSSTGACHYSEEK